MKKAVVIVAGGTGTRMNTSVPKQFLLLGGRPLLMYSLDAFSQAEPGIRIILVLPEPFVCLWSTLCKEYSFTISHEVVHGGETRFHSVSNALNLIEGDGLIAIHDGARPLVSQPLIQRAFQSALQNGNAIPAIAVSESVRKIDERGSHPVNRHDYRIIQTPQIFGTAQLKQAYRQAYRAEFTDDATVLESTGEIVHLVDGEPLNIKITQPEDLILAEYLLNCTV